MTIFLDPALKDDDGRPLLWTVRHHDKLPSGINMLQDDLFEVMGSAGETFPSFQLAETRLRAIWAEVLPLVLGLEE